MIFYDKKRIIYLLLISGIGFLLFIYIAIPLMYEWYARKTYPFSHLSINQTTDTIRVFAPWDWSGKIIQTIDYNKKKIIFTLTWSNDEIKPFYNFPLNGLIGYEMCYENKYGEHCFGKTK